MYEKGLYSERGCVIKRNAWNAEIPLRTDKTPYADDAPYMIATQESLDDLNTRLEEKSGKDSRQDRIRRNYIGTQVEIERFRPNILIDKCAAWNDDKWLSIHIGDVALQCLKPSLRCVMTTIDPCTGMKDSNVEPLKTLRRFRLAPLGPMRDDCKDSPMFGVDAGVIHPGYIHVGQTVYVRYKSEYLKQTPFYGA
ncbi:MOSC domain protein [Oesophagostomum dentatum]|uniref:MOSC domain protein n=1 Tax=Oesophagostomum dentatum TaxID=61180 RepID=A0A0B1SH43_OESDE|nr:MOSC domain protein [Oesophagostomum dentatum]